MRISWPLRDKRWCGSRPCLFPPSFPLLALVGEGEERKKGGDFIVLLENQASFTAWVAGRGVRAVEIALLDEAITPSLGGRSGGCEDRLF